MIISDCDGEKKLLKSVNRNQKQPTATSFFRLTVHNAWHVASAMYRDYRCTCTTRYWKPNCLQHTYTQQRQRLSCVITASQHSDITAERRVRIICITCLDNVSYRCRHKIMHYWYWTTALQETVCKCVILNAHNSNNSVTQLTTITYGKKNFSPLFCTFADFV